MKKRNLFLTLGLALTLGAGVAGGLSVNRGEAKEVEAAGTKVFYVYASGEITDYYNGNSHYDWLAHAYDAIEAFVYKEGGDSLSEWPGTLMHRITEDVVGLNFNDTMNADSLILNNCYTDNTDVRNRSTYDKATPISFDISSHNMFTLEKYNCPNGTDSGQFDKDYTWSLKIKNAGTSGDTNAVLAYDYSDKVQFENLTVSLTKGTTFTIEDSLGTAIVTGETGTGSAFTKGDISYDAVNGNFVVNSTGSYEVYAKPSVEEKNSAASFNGVVWMQRDSASEANEWAENFLATGCATASTGTMAKWSTHASSFAELTEGARNLLKGEAHVDHETVVTGNVKLAVQRYDYVLERYGRTLYSDFMGRVDAGKVTPKDANPGFTINNSNTNDTIIPIIAVVSISLVVVASIFVIRRRKEQE